MTIKKIYAVIDPLTIQNKAFQINKGFISLWFQLILPGVGYLYQTLAYRLHKSHSIGC